MLYSKEFKVCRSSFFKYNIECKIIDDLEIYDNSKIERRVLRWGFRFNKFNGKIS